MIALEKPSLDRVPAITRLCRLAPLGRTEIELLTTTIGETRRIRAHREFVTEGQEAGETRIIVSGWAARMRLLPDGRRQFLSFLLPGDLIGFSRHAQPLSISSIVALNDVLYCNAPSAQSLPRLGEAYAMSAALEESHLLGQITRLGRLSAQERISDLMLELHERLSLVGLASQGTFEMPLTQEMLADALGLTSVHVNRMVQSMRREGDIEWKGRLLTLHDPDRLAAKVGRVPTAVTQIRF